MTQINYEVEVKRVYKRATTCIIGEQIAISDRKPKKDCILKFLGRGENEAAAWQSAYNTIQSQNKEERI